MSDEHAIGNGVSEVKANGSALPPSNRFAEPEEEKPVKRPSVFDDLEAHKLEEHDEDVAGPEEISSVPVKRPAKKNFVRFHPDYQFTAYLHSEEDQVAYVAPSMRQQLKDEGFPIRKVVLVPYVNHRGSFFLWDLTATDVGDWHASGMRIVRLGRAKWVRIISRKDISAYTHRAAIRDYGEPEWPPLTLNQILELAFPPKRYIDSPEHDLVRDTLHG